MPSRTMQITWNVKWRCSTLATINEAMDGVLALLQSTLRSVQEMQALASLPNNQLNCYRAYKQPNEHCYRACRRLAWIPYAVQLATFALQQQTFGSSSCKKHVKKRSTHHYTDVYIRIYVMLCYVDPNRALLFLVVRTVEKHPLSTSALVAIVAKPKNFL